MRSALITAALVAAVAAAPTQVTKPNIDIAILNYALTLEHLENTFYKQALANYTEADFRKAGVNPEFYCNLKTISSDEQTHVDFLNKTIVDLGFPAVEKCEQYDFGVTTVEGFLAVANILEGVGVSAYLGAAASITEDGYLTAAGSVLTVEARHSAYLRDNQLQRQSPFPSPFDVPLGFNDVYSLAAPFIKNCTTLGRIGVALKQFPRVDISPATPAKAGDKITFTSDADPKLAFFAGTLGFVSAPLSSNDGKTFTVTIPAGVQGGQAYLILTKEGAEKPTDDNTVAIGIASIEDDVTKKAATYDGRYKGYKWNSKHF